jgi:hypothetical protein
MTETRCTQNRRFERSLKIEVRKWKNELTFPTFGGRDNSAG